MCGLFLNLHCFINGFVVTVTVTLSPLTIFMEDRNISLFIAGALWYVHSISGAQPEILQGRAGFVELGHFDKLFVKNTQKKAPQVNILELFLLDTLKTTFWMEDWTQEWTQLGLFFPKLGHFFRFSKKGRGGLLPSLPLVARLDILERGFNCPGQLRPENG